MGISKSYCPFCHKAKAALNNYKINPDNFEWLEIEDREDCNEIQAYMKQLTGASSVPRVFIGGSCIGGGDETSAAHRSPALWSSQNVFGPPTAGRVVVDFKDRDQYPHN